MKLNVALIDVDGHNYPNLALMKISAWHKQQGNRVEWYAPLLTAPDMIYASKVFTFTPEAFIAARDEKNAVIHKGGTGFRTNENLPDEIEKMHPDYSIYPQFSQAYGFLTRGCIRNCPWCVVPQKEGSIKEVCDIETIAEDRKHLVLMDNNFLAVSPDFIKEQLETAAKRKLYLDFNQGLDARLVNSENAALLARSKWKAQSGNNGYIRFSCDTEAVVESVILAMKKLRKAGYTGKIFIYFLAKDIESTLRRLEKILQYDKRINPFVMPYRNLNGNGKIENHELQRLANWCNRAWIRKSCEFKDYKGA